MLVGLQYLRAFAAVLVVFFHLIISAVFNDRWFSDYPGLIHIGQIGVDIFFVLSGFIITYSMYNRKSMGSKVQFILLRIIRIYPMYWLYSLAVLIVFLSPFTKAYTFDFLYFLKSMLLFPTYNAEGGLYPLLIVGWTLVCEMYFYLIFCACRSSNKWKSLVYVFFSFLFIFIFAKYFLSSNAITEFLSQTIFFEFTAGMLLYNLFSHHKGYELIHKAKFLIRLIAISNFIILLCYWDELNAFREILNASFSIFALLSVLSIRKNKDNIISKFFISVGDASYSLYLSHLLFVMVITGLWKRGILLPAHGHEIFYFLFVIFICITFSILSYRLIEKNINSIGSNFVKNNH